MKTYTSRSSRPSKNQATSPSIFPVPSQGQSGCKRKRPLFEKDVNGAPPSKKPDNKQVNGTKGKALTQLHFSLDTSVIRNCRLCDLSYTRGAPADEALHKAHCTRVRRGMEWGREEEKERISAGIKEIQINLSLRPGIRGRILAIPATLGGKIGQKLSCLLSTVNLALSAPELPPEALRLSKVYIFLAPSLNSREVIAGCVVAQRIKSAMSIHHQASTEDAYQAGLVHVDGGLYCKPARLPTPLGIPRMFVVSTHRRQGIAMVLLDAVAKTFVHGCELDPTKGQIAFSQPTTLGRSVMEKWGGGSIRIFEE